MSKDLFVRTELQQLAIELRWVGSMLKTLQKQIEESEARIAAFESKLRPQSPASEHTASQEDTNQGKAQ